MCIYLRNFKDLGHIKSKMFGLPRSLDMKYYFIDRQAIFSYFFMDADLV